MFKVLTQDSFCFPGCIPEGDGPGDNGDRFDTKEEAIADGLRMLESIFDEEIKVNGDSRTVRAVFEECKRELLDSGETSATLPYREDSDEQSRDSRGRFTDNVSLDGTRFVAFTVEQTREEEDEDDGEPSSHDGSPDREDFARGT
jgi:hypothetical protein